MEYRIEKDTMGEVKVPAASTSSIPAIVVTMPKMSDTMQEGTIAAWLKKVGDPVKSGEKPLETITATRARPANNAASSVFHEFVKEIE